MKAKAVKDEMNSLEIRANGLLYEFSTLESMYRREFIYADI